MRSSYPNDISDALKKVQSEDYVFVNKLAEVYDDHIKIINEINKYHEKVLSVMKATGELNPFIPTIENYDNISLNLENNFNLALKNLNILVHKTDRLKQLRTDQIAKNLHIFPDELFLDSTMQLLEQTKIKLHSIQNNIPNNFPRMKWLEEAIDQQNKLEIELVFVTKKYDKERNTVNKLNIAIMQTYNKTIQLKKMCLEKKREANSSQSTEQTEPPAKPNTVVQLSQNRNALYGKIQTVKPLETKRSYANDRKKPKRPDCCVIM
ncbi:MAG: hypothetical protein P4M12_08045 [Gammaproteobacteria bacterium]|nr:hypothetical protein [Gammaproteobacteria bacterium]